VANYFYLDKLFSQKEQQNFIENLLLRTLTYVSTSSVGWPTEETGTFNGFSLLMSPLLRDKVKFIS
jgi:hypothetical protein